MHTAAKKKSREDVFPANNRGLTTTRKRIQEETAHMLRIRERVKKILDEFDPHPMAIMRYLTVAQVAKLACHSNDSAIREQLNALVAKFPGQYEKFDGELAHSGRVTGYRRTALAERFPNLKDEHAEHA